MNGKKILFVEDEPVAQTAYRNRLKREGFETLFAEDSDGALNTLSQGCPDLVVLDLMLPRANGAEVLKHIRSQDRLKGMPVLILSNDYVAGQSQRAMESGATRGILKAECTPARLVETVRDMLGFASAFDLTDKPVSDDSQSQAFIAAAEEAFADEMNLKETREEFIHKAPAEIANIREHCLAYVKAGISPGGLEYLNHLFQDVRFFATRAGLSGCVRIAVLASAFEALLFEIVFKPERANASTSQTLAQAVDCLERLCQKSDTGVHEPSFKAKILIVDDDVVNNHAMVGALKRAHFEPVSLEDPAKAVSSAEATTYDIVLLDINMQGASGFELCEKMRAMPQYKNTPIIFVSASGDFQHRAHGILSGGNDLILKPISPVELVLKTTMHLLQPQGLWTEDSAVASVLKTTIRLMQPETSSPTAHKPTLNGSANGSAMDSTIPFKPTTLGWSRAQTTPDADEKPSFSTEMIRKAWTGERVDLPKPDKKDESVPVANGNEIAKTTPDVKDESPTKCETADGNTDKLANSAEITNRAVPEISIELPEPMEEEKANHINGADKVIEPKPPEIKDELSEIEIPPILNDAPPAVAPTPAVEKTDVPITPQPEPTELYMETKNKPTFDDVARGVARIIFGDENITDMNVRLTRIALEKYTVPGTQKIDDVARGVTQIIFGDDKVSDMNMRLTKIALERYNVAEVLHLQNGSNGAPSL